MNCKDHQRNRRRGGARRARRNSLCRLAVWSLLLTQGIVTAQATEDTVAQQQRRLQAMPPAEKQELWERQQRFYRLGPEQQDRLRDLHGAVNADAQPERLQQVMTRYTQWLKTLPAGERAELLTLPPQERIAHIRTLMQRQAASDMRYLVEDKLSDPDLAAITLWMKGIVKQREADILEKMPMLNRGMLRSQDPDQRVETLLRMLQRLGPRPEFLRPTDEDIARLKEQLSSTALQRLNKAKEEGRLTELAEQWMRAAMMGRRAGPPVDKSELERFYREEIDPREREYLESLSRERMHSRLMLLFHAQRYGRDFGPNAPGPGPRGMGGGFRGRSNRPWQPDRRPSSDDQRRPPRSKPPSDEL